MSRGFRLQETEYPAVRRVMGPDRERLDDAALEGVLEGLFPGTDAMDVEDFMSTLQSFGRQVAPIAQRALPGVIQGASQGAVAGPWGALAGGIIGGASSLLSGGGPAAPAPAPAAPPAPVAPMPFAAPAPAVTAVPLAASPAPAAGATAQLMALLSRPETMQALMALLMGGAGRTAVPVAGRDVPAVAFANAIAETAARVAEVAGHPLEQSMSEYLFDSLGQPRGDLVNPSERAALLLSDLAAVSAQEAQDAEAQEQENERWMEAAEAYEQDAISPIDAYENALLGYEAS